MRTSAYAGDDILGTRYLEPDAFFFTQLLFNEASDKVKVGFTGTGESHFDLLEATGNELGDGRAGKRRESEPHVQRKNV